MCNTHAVRPSLVKLAAALVFVYPGLALADASAWEAISLLAWSSVIGTSIAVLALACWRRASVKVKLFLLVPVGAAGFALGSACLFLFMIIVGAYTDWRLKRERHAFLTHPAFVAACNGSPAALTSALTPKVIGGRSLDLLQVFKECLAEPNVVRPLERGGVFFAPVTLGIEPARRKPEPPPLELLLAGREDVFVPMMRAMHSREMTGTSMLRSAYGGGEYCLALEIVHQANDVGLVNALAADGLPLDCKGAARVWWAGIMTQPERPTQTVKWLQTLQKHGIDLAAPARPPHPDYASPRGVLADAMRCTAPSVLEVLIRAGNDPDTRWVTETSMQVVPKEIWYRRRSAQRPTGCQTGSDALGADIDAVARVDFLMGVNLPPPMQPVPPTQMGEAATPDILRRQYLPWPHPDTLPAGAGQAARALPQR